MSEDRSPPAADSVEKSRMNTSHLIGSLMPWCWGFLRVRTQSGSGTSDPNALDLGVAGLIVAVPMLMLVTYFGWGQAFESQLRDYGLFFDPTDEGTIIVDAPQLFTRERLLNERLRETEWIDRQIELVDEKLENGQFGKPDALAVSELLLKLRGPAGNGNQTKPASRAVDNEPQSETNAAGDAYDLLKEVSGFAPSPQTAFDAASDFRERLSLQRYETILDDAHDLGENTLHRLNFHLTISPARQYTDSLVAVSVRMSETFDDSQMIESYARLMIESRKRMQDLVEQLIADRSLLFDYGSSYKLDPSEETDSNSLIYKIPLNTLGENEMTAIINSQIDSYNDELLEHIGVEIENTLKRKSSTFWTDIFSDRELLKKTSKIVSYDCMRSYTIFELLKRSGETVTLDEVNKRITRLRDDIESARTNSEEAKPTDAATLSNGSQQGPKQVKQNELRDFESAFKREPVTVACWDRRKAIQVSRLRLVGALYHLGLIRQQTSAPLPCSNSATITQSLRVVLGQARVIPAERGACSSLMIKAEGLRTQLVATGAEIGHTGLAFVLRESLEKRMMETTRRRGKLGNFFKFSIDGCTVEHCQVRVFTYGEQPSISSDHTKASRVGQREALRLYLELSCFANARSYTVWPRAGERDVTVDTSSQSADGRLAVPWGAVEATSNLETARRRDRDHVFGIGDWGVRKDDLLPACTSEFMAFLADYPIEVDSPEQFREKLQGDPEFEHAWKDIIVPACLRLQKRDATVVCDHKIALKTLAAIAVSRRTITTSVGWVVSPRADQPGGRSYHKAMSLPLSAIVSLPSWWGRLKIEITTCWVRPKKLSRHVAPGSLCEGAESNPPSMIEIPLPGKAQEVLQKLGFFIIRTPYLERDEGEAIEAGRTARIRLVGGRLWKNPRVRLGSQWHDRIEVLPNMQGLIATFDCVQPSSDDNKQIARFDAGQLMSFDDPTLFRIERRQTPPVPSETLHETRWVQVWTSEGFTLPQPIKVFAFRPRHLYKAKPEAPCWPIEPPRASASKADEGAEQATASTVSTSK